MKNSILFITLLFLASCQTGTKKKPIEGTWKLITGKIIKGKDTVFTDYTKGQKLIKIINGSHFSFVRHDLNKGKDSSAVFVAGAGAYTYDKGIYIEQLEFCTGRSWEGNEFKFNVRIQGDTLIQQGIEEIASENVKQEIVETYVRIKT